MERIGWAHGRDSGSGRAESGRRGKIASFKWANEREGEEGCGHALRMNENERVGARVQRASAINERERVSKASAVNGN